MSVRSVPQFLITGENLELLIRLLIEKEALRRSLKVRDFGPPVTDAKVAQRLFERVVRSAREVLQLNADHGSVPKLVLTNQLSRLSRQTLKSYIYFLPVTLIPLFLVLWQSVRGPLLYAVVCAGLFLLVVPLLLHRRTRIHLEHQCTYGENKKGEAEIVIDQVPAIQFQSYLAHEYAHHIWSIQRNKPERWLREGWARLVQWQVVEYLYGLEGNPAYLYHALAQIIGELKFACQIISSALHRRLPIKVKLIRTIYHRNPFFTLLTGTPGSRLEPLLEHAIGTSGYFLAVERLGLKTALNEDWVEGLNA